FLIPLAHDHDHQPSCDRKRIVDAAKFTTETEYLGQNISQSSSGRTDDKRAPEEEMTFRPCALLCLLACVFGALPADAATITVRSTADAGGTCPGAGCTLRQAIAVAASGDTVNFALPASATIALTSGELVIAKSMTVKGPGA